LLVVRVVLECFLRQGFFRDQDAIAVFGSRVLRDVLGHVILRGVKSRVPANGVRDELVGERECCGVDHAACSGRRAGLLDQLLRGVAES